MVSPESVPRIAESSQNPPESRIVPRICPRICMVSPESPRISESVWCPQNLPESWCPQNLVPRISESPESSPESLLLPGGALRVFTSLSRVWIFAVVCAVTAISMSTSFAGETTSTLSKAEMLAVGRFLALDLLVGERVGCVPNSRHFLARKAIDSEISVTRDMALRVPGATQIPCGSYTELVIINEVSPYGALVRSALIGPGERIFWLDPRMSLSQFRYARHSTEDGGYPLLKMSPRGIEVTVRGCSGSEIPEVQITEEDIRRHVDEIQMFCAVLRATP